MSKKLTVILDANIAAFKAKMKTAEATLVGFEKSAAGMKLAGFSRTLATVGEKATKTGKTLTKTVTLPILGLGAAAIKTTADFDASMSQVMAVSGATGEEFDKLREKAREMGAKTKFSASEAADAMNYMAMAGWKTEDMLNGIEGIMNLAAASGEDLATTSDIVTDALTAFGLTASDSGHFADVLAAASSNANTNVRMMGETFKYAAPVAGAFGFKVEDVAQAIGLMGNAGIKSSQAGTSLRNIMSKMTNDIVVQGEALGQVTIKTQNADGTMRDLNDILADCRVAWAGLTDAEKASEAQTIFGKNAMSGWLALMNAAPGDVAKLEDALANADGASQRMADTMQDNLSGQLTILKSQLQELAISFGDLMMPAIRKFVKRVQELVDKFNSMDDATRMQIIKFAALAAAIGPVLIIVGKVATGISALIRVGGKAVGAVKAISTVVGGAKTALIGLAVAGVALVVKAIADYIERQREFEKATDGLRSASAGATTALDDEADAMGRQQVNTRKLKASVDDLAKSQADLADEMLRNNNEAEVSGRMLDRYGSTIEELSGRSDLSAGDVARLKDAVKELNEQLGTEYTVEVDPDGRYRVMAGDAELATQELQKLIEAKKAEARADAYAANYKASVEAQIEAEQKLAEAKQVAAEKTQAYHDAMARGEGNLSSYEAEMRQANEAVDEAQGLYDAATDSVRNSSDALDLATEAAAENASAWIKAVDANRTLASSLTVGGKSASKFAHELEAAGVDVKKLQGLSEKQSQFLATAYDPAAQNAAECFGQVTAVGTEAFDRIYDECNGDADLIEKRLAELEDVDIEPEVKVTDKGTAKATEKKLTALDKIKLKVKEQVVKEKGVSAVKTALDSIAGIKIPTKTAKVSQTGDDPLGYINKWNKAKPLSKTLKVVADITATATKLVAKLFSASGSVSRQGGILNSIPKYASGGIVHRPTLTNIGWVGENGAEAVVPLTNRRYMRPVGRTIADEMVSALQGIAGPQFGGYDSQSVQLAGINQSLDSMQLGIYLDGKTLVGHTARRYDARLGRDYAMNGRGRL